MRVTRTLRAAIGAALTGALLLTTGGVATADPVRDAQWPLDAFDARSIWRQATGKGITVAVIEPGFRTTHQDLTGKFLPGKEFPNATADKSTLAPKPGEDIRDHGTAMAGLIAGHGHGAGGKLGIKGLAPDVKILPLVADKAGPEATRYAADHGAGVINMSYVADKNTPDMCESIQYALDKGVVVVAGVGNDALPETRYPAACPGVIGVGAVDEYGKVWDGSNYNATVDVLAPGVKLAFAGGKSDSSYSTGDGTSAATAYVSAAVALLREKYPELSPGQIANRLVKTAGLPKGEKAKGLKVPDAHYGYGFIQPYGALTRDIPAGPKEGPLPMPTGKASGAAAAPGAEGRAEAGESAGSGNTALVVGGGALGLLVVVGIVAGVVVAARRRKSAGPPQAWG